jgi:histidine triad (HIT) family protein
MSLFMKIIRGELPSYKVYEDEKTFAFLTRDAIALGHTLVIPKVEVDHFADVPRDYFLRVHEVSQPLAKAIQKATGCKRVGTAVIGLEVPHFHLHLVPMNSIADLDFRKARVYSPEDNLRMQKQIVGAL